MQLKIGLPPDPSNINKEVLKALFEQVKKGTIEYRWIGGERRRLKEYSEEWCVFLDQLGMPAEKMGLRSRFRGADKPLTNNDALSISEVLEASENTENLLELVIAYYNSEEKHNQIERKDMFQDILEKMFKNCNMVTLYDRYLLRDTYAVVTGDRENAKGKKKNLGFLLSSIQGVASENRTDSIEVGIESVLVSYRQFKEIRIMEGDREGSSPEAYMEWFENESLSKRRSFAEWLLEGENYPNLTIKIYDGSHEKIYDKAEHDRFLHLENSETWVSTAGFNLAARRSDQELDNKTYIIRVEKPKGLRKTQAYPLYAH
tara:strand:+ start:456 stop:1406 length:951 start_codon:yes stop_codon:yes gene_type:complete